MLMTVTVVVVLYSFLAIISFIWRPKMPTCLFGFITGDIRLEDGIGNDFYIEVPSPFVFLAPSSLGGRKFAITHIQYKSHFGFYLAYPACFYFWFMPKFQETKLDDDGKTVLKLPGTERGFVFRLPGFRWEGATGNYIKTKGQAGFHYD